MDTDITPEGDALEDFPLREASRLYAVDLTTLRRLVRRGQIDAYKARGAWGREWRVTRRSLETLGYLPRSVSEAAGGNDERVARLERELAAARRAVAAERSRAEEADRRLGEALMETGRLKAALPRAEDDAEEDVVTTVDMTALGDFMSSSRTGRPSIGRS